MQFKFSKHNKGKKKSDKISRNKNKIKMTKIFTIKIFHTLNINPLRYFFSTYYCIIFTRNDNQPLTSIIRSAILNDRKMTNLSSGYYCARQPPDLSLGLSLAQVISMEIDRRIRFRHAAVDRCVIGTHSTQRTASRKYHGWCKLRMLQRRYMKLT